MISNHSYCKSVFILLILATSCSSSQTALKSKNITATNNIALVSAIYSNSELSNPEKVNRFKLLIEENPNNYMANYWYIQSVGIADSNNLEKQYAIWMKKFPKSTTIPLALGNALAQESNRRAKFYFEQTIKVNPKSTSAWKGLSLLAYFEGDKASSSDYLLKGTLANPTDLELAYRYALKLDKQECDKHLTKLIQNFPKSEYAAKALFYQALLTNDNQEKIRLYEKLKEFFIAQKQKYEVVNDAMLSYYEFLLVYDVNKTLPLLNKLQDQKFRPYDWTILQDISAKIITAKNLIGKSEGFAALTILNGIEFPYFVQKPEEFISILKAKAIELSDGTSTAYTALIMAFGKNPTTTKYKIILAYGLTQNKDSGRVKTDIISVLRKNAANATPFKLYNLKTTDSLSLYGFRGSVVLLTYWYPKCGPCRNELPHFESVIKRITSAIKYVSINIVPKEDDMVLRMMASNNYNFIPLTETKFRNKGNLDNMGAAPANFLIDKYGYLIFRDFYINDNNEDDLELMISLLN